MSEDAAFDDPGCGTPSGLPSGFRAVVTHALGELGFSVVGWDSDGVNVLAPSTKAKEESEHSIGLTNLYRRARAVEKTEWPGMIREFLEHVTSTFESQEIPDLATIADRLRPRLGQPFSREARAFPWGIPHPGTGLEINLVIDFPNTMAYVTQEMLNKSSKSLEDLLDIAFANLRDSTAEDFFEQVSEDLDIFVGHTGDGYDSARALLIEDLLPDSPCGFLVAVPSREELAVWPVSYEAISKIHVIKLFAEHNFRDHAYPVTADVFWVWHGTWYPFGIQIDEENVTVSPPDEFLAALRQLGGEESSEEAGPNDEVE